MNLAQEKQARCGCEEQEWMSSEFTVNEKLREGQDRTMIMTMLSKGERTVIDLKWREYL